MFMIKKYYSNSTDKVEYIMNFDTIKAIKDKYVWDDCYTYDVEPRMTTIIRKAN